ncbi:hypothetical protein ACFPN2_15580 [Steroidobacter flavus]|uniref:Uncharacterized protein n=1 Tax=Steroidobacter flavus TaxID=1842136 RepID=A0ABV8SU63_9GAMM
MQSERFQFSVSRHITYLAGYLNAVGRLQTTDSELWAHTAHDASAVPALRLAERSRAVVENWSREFGSLVEDFLRLDQRERLGFYLIDYICYFEDFTPHAECFKLDCEPLSSGTIEQAVYLLQLEGNQEVLLIFQRIDKARRSPSEIE